MKKLTLIAISFLFIGYSSSVKAQDNVNAQKKDSKVKETSKDVKKGVEKGAHEVKEAGKDVGDKTAEVAVKGAAVITDQKLKDRVGPDGQTIYIDNHDKFYWVNDKGRKMYISKSALRNK